MLRYVRVVLLGPCGSANTSARALAIRKWWSTAHSADY